MGVDFEGCKRVIAAGRKCDPKKNISVGFQQRYGPVYLEAYKRLKAGDIGELATARGFWISSDPFQRMPYDDPKIEKLRNWFCYKAYSGDFIVEQDCHGVDVLNWFAGRHPVSAIGGGGKGRRQVGDNLDHVNVTYSFGPRLSGYLHGTQLISAGWREVREQFFCEKASVTTHRNYYEVQGDKGAPVRTASKREITIDAIEQFLSHIIEGRQKNMAFDACDSTFTSLLGRMAVDTKREVTWEELLKSE
jgi:predicted dehydrogenase